MSLLVSVRRNLIRLLAGKDLAIVHNVTFNGPVEVTDPQMIFSNAHFSGKPSH